MLYIISTPIGNMGDITVRAIETLKMVDYIVCEDTRVTGKLLKYHDIKKPLIVYNEYNTPRDKILTLLKNGSDIALVSDAGTPLISDPGYKLIEQLIKTGEQFTSIPGACSVINALSISGLPTDKFTFCGFANKKEFPKFATIETTLIFFESAKRLQKTLKNMLDVFGNRKVAVCRELTKLYEEAKRGTLQELIEYYEAPPKGEIVILLDGYEKKEYTEEEIDELFYKLIEKKTFKTVVDEICYTTGMSKKWVYDYALKKKNSLQKGN